MEVAPPRRQPSSWSDIPVELAGLVLGRLPAHVDRVRFAAVCPQWRAAARQVPLPPPMPMLLLPDATVYSLPGSKPFPHFPDCAGYTDACGTGNWLVFKTEDGFFLRDPFFKATVTLPPLSRARLQHVGDESVDDAGHVWMEMDERKEPSASKIIFCSPHLIAAIFTFRGEERTRIAVCQPGATSWWSIRVSCRAPQFGDIVFHQGKPYALDCNNSLYAVDISVHHSTGDPWVSQIQQVIGQLFTWPRIFLPNNVLISLGVTYRVEYTGALLLVYRKIDLRLKKMQWDGIEVLGAEGNRFEVYEADFGQSQWPKVTTLGNDQVLFLHRQCSRSVCTSHTKMPGDRIFFVENNKEHYNCSEEASSSYSVYHMRDSMVSTPLPMVSWKPGRVFATWLFPQG